MDTLLAIPRRLYDLVLAHCLAERPHEAVGFLTGRQGVVRRAVAVRNAHPDPVRRFRVDPVDALVALRPVEAGDEEWIALYHSHPDSVAYPSPRDLALAEVWQARGPAGGPAFLFIVSLASHPPDARAYRLAAGRDPAPVPYRKLDLPDGEWLDLR
ncbi:M67 family metallopeptidase [Caldinitratiruptor microaerophilus]|uniref:MPN domain-containing protein n=1 Tax=Caldinitratiruptor microaerophilus TaxID=671077 RepID=A0AA35G669_9FIRM|nr:M67 family metallopeptidase [Caldinitratiruptor microaerophilus]BDG60811.1 hypothetical protein caldi_19010 [Caldinitratiruptor microaerophilus]